MRTSRRPSGPPSSRWIRASPIWAVWPGRPAGAGWRAGAASQMRGSRRERRCSWACHCIGSPDARTACWTGSSRSFAPSALRMTGSLAPRKEMMKPRSDDLPFSSHSATRRVILSERAVRARSEGSGGCELWQVGAVPLQELLVDVTVGVVPHLADPVSPEPDHAAGALVHDVLRRALEPGPLADFHDHAVVGVVPVAPHVLGAPVGGPETRLAVPQGVEHPLPTVPFAAERWGAGHPVHDVVVKQPADRGTIAGEQRLLVRLRDLQAAAHTIASSGFTRGLALRPARSIGLSIMARF